MIIGLAALIPSAIFHCIAVWLDMDESVRKLYYAKQEGTASVRNDDGTIKVRKAWVQSLLGPAAVGVGLGAAAYFGTSRFPHQAASALMYGLIVTAAPMLFNAIYRMTQWYDNQRRSRANRLKQIQWRKDLRAAIESGNAEWTTRLLNLRSEVENIWHAFWAPWLTVEAASDSEARERLIPVLVEWLAIPDTDIKRVWVDTKYHPTEGLAS